MKRTLLLGILAMATIDHHVNAQATGTLDVNDAHMVVRSNGFIGQGSTSAAPGFVVPAQEGTSPMHASGLWISGYTPGGQTKMTAHLFNEAVDFYPGPLTIDGTASISPSTSQAYDQVWSVTAEQIAMHEAYFACLADPGCEVNSEFPAGYTIPEAFLTWPAMGDVSAGQAVYLAPFMDYNTNGEYDPANGDHPCILGDQALFTIFNDKADQHFQTGSQPIGVEVHMMPFAYDGNAALQQTVFVHYTIINRGTETLANFRIAHFADLELGCGGDDIVGTDVGRSLVYVANGDAVDENCLGATGYGDRPPAFGMAVLKATLLEPDGMDNAQDPLELYVNGTGYADGTIDNERFGLSNSMVFFREGNNAVTDPSLGSNFANYQRNIWKDGTPITYGGSGYSTDPNATPSLFAFPGNTDPLGLGTGGIPQAPWYATLSNLGPAVDPRVLADMGPESLEPGEHITLLVAYVYARSGEVDPLASIVALQQRVDSIREFAEDIPGMFTLGETGPFTCTEGVTGTGIEQHARGAMVFFPNPVADRLTIRAQGLAAGTILNVFDARGQLVAQFPSTGTNTQLAVTGLAMGLYTIRASGTTSILTGRFMKE